LDPMLGYEFKDLNFKVASHIPTASNSLELACHSPWYLSAIEC
jgi:hypothetical protein